jgi:hypothetical protein
MKMITTSIRLFSAVLDSLFLVKSVDPRNRNPYVCRIGLLGFRVTFLVPTYIYICCV